MKVNRKDLLRLMLEQDGEELDISVLLQNITDKQGKKGKLPNFEVPYNSNNRTTIGIRTKHDFGPVVVDTKTRHIDAEEQIERIERRPIPIKKKQQTINSSFMNPKQTSGFDFGTNYAGKSVEQVQVQVPLTEKQKERQRIYAGRGIEPMPPLNDYVQSLVDDGYIQNLHYASCLSGNISYMDFLKKDPEVFLKKRIEWKINKIIGFKGIGRGSYKDYYEMNFSEFANSKKGQQFIELCEEAYGKLNTGYNETDIMAGMYLAGVPVEKILYSIIRPERSPGKCSKISLEYSIRILGEGRYNVINLIDRMAFKDIEPKLTKFFHDLAYKIAECSNGKLSEEQVVYLVQPNYKEVLDLMLLNKELRKLYQVRNTLSRLEYLEKDDKRYIANSKKVMKFIYKHATTSLIDSLEQADEELNRIESVLYNKKYDIEQPRARQSR